jgi:hypothetical protein
MDRSLNLMKTIKDLHHSFSQEPEIGKRFTNPEILDVRGGHFGTKNPLNLIILPEATAPGADSEDGERLGLMMDPKVTGPFKSSPMAVPKEPLNLVRMEMVIIDGNVLMEELSQLPGAFENHIVPVFDLMEKPGISEVASMPFFIGENGKETIDPSIANRLDHLDVQGVGHRLKSNRLLAVGQDIIVGFDGKSSGQSLSDEPSIAVEEDLHIERQMGRKAK